MNLTERLDRAVSSAIENGKIVGAVTIVARDGEVLYRKADGWLDREAGTRMRPDAIFRFASLTKPIVAATALAMIERQLLGLDNAVSDHLPWFRPRLADGREARITIRHLLTHTSGLGYDYPAEAGITTGMQDTNLSLEENYRLVSDHPLNFEPGTAWLYGVSTDVLGAIIAALHGGELADAVAHYVTEPLGMSDTGFSVTDTERLAVPYADDTPEPRRMRDPDTVILPDGRVRTISPGRIFNQRAFQSGGAGGVGTAGDMFAFLDAIRNRGTPILNHDSVAQAIQNQIDEIPMPPGNNGIRFGFLGAVVVDPAATQRPHAPGTIRWGGTYGHDWFVDFTNGLTAVMLTNTAVEGNVGAYPRTLRNAIYDR